MEKTSPQPLALFYCYARKDHLLREELEKHLAGLDRSGFVTTWYDGEIVAGTAWEEEIKTQLNTADIILLLVSPDFIKSDYCYSIEMKRALERHFAREARVIPILLRSVDWSGTPFSELQMLPTGAQPVHRWPNRDEAFADVAMHIRRVVSELIEQRNSTSTSQDQRHNEEEAPATYEAPSQHPIPPKPTPPRPAVHTPSILTFVSSFVIRSRPSSGKILFLVGLILLIAASGIFTITFLRIYQQRPILRGRLDPSLGNVNLSREGTLDWAHWGYQQGDNANPNRFVGNPVASDCQYIFHCFNHKLGANNQISDYTAIGNVSPYRLHTRDNPVFYTWYNGTPIVAAADVRAGEYMGLANNGFQITVPADQTIRLLKLYVSVYQGQAKLTAALSDKNVPMYEDSSFNTYGGWNQSKSAVYSLTYGATSPNQLLTITYTLQTDMGGGNVMLFAATLSRIDSNTNNIAPAARTTTPSQTYAQATNHTPVFIDPLQDNTHDHKWLEKDSDTQGSCSFREGAYHVIANPYDYYSCGASMFPTLQDFVFQGEVVMVSGSGAGFAIHFIPYNYRYLFYISEDGTYTVTRDIAGNNVTLLHDSSSTIHTRSGEQNLLAILARGNTFDLYVNNAHVTSFSDDTYSQARVENLAISGSNVLTDVAFRNVKAWTL